MNRLYFLVVCDDWGGIYVSAPNEEVARRIGQKDPLIYEPLDIDENKDCFRCKYIKDTNLPTKFLDINDILHEGCHWWCCENNECQSKGPFKYVGNERYKCLDCENIFNIPYTGL